MRPSSVPTPMRKVRFDCEHHAHSRHVASLRNRERVLEACDPFGHDLLLDNVFHKLISRSFVQTGFSPVLFRLAA